MLTIKICESERIQGVEKDRVSSQRSDSNPIPVSVSMDSEVMHHFVPKCQCTILYVLSNTGNKCKESN